MAVNDSMAFDDANANEAKENLATFLSEITKVHHDCTELGQKILEALDEEEKQSLEKLLELADFGKELADLRHCGCPGAAKERGVASISHVEETLSNPKASHTKCIKMLPVMIPEDSTLCQLAV